MFDRGLVKSRGDVSTLRTLPVRHIHPLQPPLRQRLQGRRMNNLDLPMAGTGRTEWIAEAAEGPKALAMVQVTTAVVKKAPREGGTKTPRGAGAKGLKGGVSKGPQGAGTKGPKGR